MNLLGKLIPAWAIAIAAALAGAALAGGWQQMRLDSAQAEHARYREQVARNEKDSAEFALAQSEAWREIEKEHQDAIDQQTRKDAARLSAARADADRARAAGKQLQHDLDNYVRAVRGAAQDCIAAGNCSPADSPLVLLANLQRRADQRAGELAAFADDARIRGLACEAAYDSARAMTETTKGDHHE